MKQMFKVLPGCELYAKLEAFMEKQAEIGTAYTEAWAALEEHGIKPVKYDQGYEGFGGLVAVYTKEPSELFKCKKPTVRGDTRGLYKLTPCKKKTPTDLRAMFDAFPKMHYQELCSLFGVKSFSFANGYIFFSPSLRKGQDGFFYAEITEGISVPEQEGLIKL